jgi:hypothetical protein
MTVAATVKCDVLCFWNPYIGAEAFDHKMGKTEFSFLPNGYLLTRKNKD